MSLCLRLSSMFIILFVLTPTADGLGSGQSEVVVRIAGLLQAGKLDAATFDAQDIPTSSLVLNGVDYSEARTLKVSPWMKRSHSNPCQSVALSE